MWHMELPDRQINFIAKAEGFPDAPVVLPGRDFQPFGSLSINRPRVQDHLKEMYKEVIRHYDLFWWGLLDRSHAYLY